MSKINVVLDATMFDTFQSCPAKFNYRFNLNKVQQIKATALDRGTLVHIGFEHYFTALQERKSFEDAVEFGVTAFYANWANESDLEESELAALVKAFKESCEIYRERDERFEILAVEQAFSYVLHETDDVRIVMIGKIDLLVNEPGYQNVPYDHKTYSRDFPVKRKTNQFCNYAYATGSNYLIVNRVGLQTSLKPAQKHKRIPLSYDPLFLEQWKQNVIKWINSYIECCATNEWPLNDTSCDKFNRLCEYFEVCDSSGAEAKFYKLNTQFNTAEPWDVSASLGKKRMEKENE